MTTAPSARRAFGQRLRRARLESSILQADAAQAAGVTRQALSMWENGYRTIGADQLADLVQAYGVDAHALLFGESRRQIGAADHDALQACLQQLPPTQRDRIRAVLAAHLQRVDVPAVVRATPASFWPPPPRRVRRKSETPKQRQLPEASIANHQASGA